MPRDYLSVNIRPKRISIRSPGSTSTHSHLKLRYVVYYVVKEKLTSCHYRSELLTKPMSKRQRIGKAVAKKSNRKNHSFRGVKGPEDKELFSGDDWERIGQRGESHGM